MWPLERTQQTENQTNRHTDRDSENRRTYRMFLVICLLIFFIDKWSNKPVELQLTALFIDHSSPIANHHSKSSYIFTIDIYLPLLVIHNIPRSASINIGAWQHVHCCVYLSNVVLLYHLVGWGQALPKLVTEVFRMFVLQCAWTR